MNTQYAMRFQALALRRTCCIRSRSFVWFIISPKRLTPLHPFGRAHTFHTHTPTHGHHPVTLETTTPTPHQRHHCKGNQPHCQDGCAMMYSKSTQGFDSFAPNLIWLKLLFALNWSQRSKQSQQILPNQRFIYPETYLQLATIHKERRPFPPESRLMLPKTKNGCLANFPTAILGYGRTTNFVRSGI